MGTSGNDIRTDGSRATATTSVLLAGAVVLGALAVLGALVALVVLDDGWTRVIWAGVAALREGAGDVRRFRAIFDERRRAMVEGLRALGLAVRAEPTGAFYVFADARRYCERSYDFAFEILAGARVAVTPGIDFGTGGEGYLRFSYANSLPRIHEALLQSSSSSTPSKAKGAKITASKAAAAASDDEGTPSTAPAAHSAARNDDEEDDEF